MWLKRKNDLSEVIEDRGMTKLSVARKLGISPRTLSAYLSGNAKVPKARAAILINLFGAVVIDEAIDWEATHASRPA